MKLCIVSAGDLFADYGGGQVYVRHLVSELSRQSQSLGLDLCVLSVAQSFGKEYTTAYYEHIPVYQIHPTGNIHQLLSLLKPDLVHAHGEKALMAQLCHTLNIPCVITAHHGGICCPAGALLNHDDEICHIAASYTHCLRCYLRTIRWGSFFYPLVRHIQQQHYVQYGHRLDHRPFIPLLTPVGQAALVVENKLQQWQQVCSLATLLIAPSQAMASALIRNGAYRDKVRIIPHGVPTVSAAPTVTPSTDPIHFYYVGRICYVKGIHMLLQAFHAVRQPAIRLHLIGGAGNTTEERYLHRLQQQYRHDSRIIWHGKIPPDEVPALTKTFAALLHPTICLETFGLTIAEAMATHHWVIATRCGGAEMQINNGVNGTLIPPNDSHAMQTAIEQYIAHPRYPQQSKVTTLAEHVTMLYNIYQTITVR